MVVAFRNIQINSFCLFVFQDDIKADLDRVREAMKRLQTIHDNLTKRPRLDQPAAQRFVRAGLYDANNTESDKQNDAPPNKKKRREKKAEPEWVE